jgi:transketolase
MNRQQIVVNVTRLKQKRTEKGATMTTPTESIDTLCINTIRTLSIDMVQNANSGHPGLPMGAAPMAYVLWTRHLRHNPKDPAWPDRDRFVLSAGHGSALLYSLLHLTGYDLTMDDLKAFRQWESRTPGHPEYKMTPGVEATTGPLGQGTANAVGMAIAERHLANRFNRPGHTIVDHYTYALISDGDAMEGISAEACSLAGHLKLGKLILLYDSNDISLDGPTSLAFSTEDVAKRYEAYGWQVLHVSDGDTDIDAIDNAIADAKADTARPSIIIIKTTIGYGSPNRQGSADAHGAPLGVDEVALTKKKLGWKTDKTFYVPRAAASHFRAAAENGRDLQKEWKKRFSAFAAAHRDLADEWHKTLAGELPEGWDSELPSWQPGDKLATREASGKVLNAIAERVPWLIGGDADLSGSTKTTIKSADSFDGQSGDGKNFHFGVREHAMGAIANGMVYHGGIRPFVATFFVFCDYMRPPVRLAALNKLPVIYVWTHDSIAVGEDGPTHQPIEHLASLRVIPGLKVLRPADANETAEAYRFIMCNPDGPAALVLTRQKLPTIDRKLNAPASGLRKGAYILSDPPKGKPKAIIIATGSEVHVALEAKELLSRKGIRVRVVSMPSWEIFASQSKRYQESVLPASVPLRVSVEAGVSLGWSRWVGDKGVSIGVDRFGASAPGNVNLDKYGLTAKKIVAAVKKLLKK